MAKFIDRTGEIYNGIEFLERVENDKYGKVLWRLRCHCGQEFSGNGSNVFKGKIKSCGCLKYSSSFVDRTGEIHYGIEFLKRLNKKDKHGKYRWKVKCHCGKVFETGSSEVVGGNTKSCGCGKTRHGESKTRLHKCWVSMRSRCNNPIGKDYENYGGRGITYSEIWDSYENFRDWALSNGYDDNLTLDRINTNGNYSPENCRWASDATQARNKRTSKKSQSGVTGVNWVKHAKKWKARIGLRKNGKDENISLGYYTALREAIEARREAEIKHWGEEYQDFDTILNDLEELE